MRGICYLLLVVFNVLVPFRFVAFADLVSTPSDALGQAAESLEPSEPEVSGGTSDGKIFPMLYAGPGEPVAPPSYVNCVYYDVTVNGTDYTLLLPSDSESSLMVDPDGYLWNVSGSQIMGRLFTGSFDPFADTGEILYLAPCLGNNFSVNHDYGSPNYVRDYYWSDYDRLSYSTHYVRVLVRDSFHQYKSGDLLQYVLIFLVGCCLICLWKRSAR